MAIPLELVLGVALALVSLVSGLSALMLARASSQRMPRSMPNMPLADKQAPPKEPQRVEGSAAKVGEVREAAGEEAAEDDEGHGVGDQHETHERPHSKEEILAERKVIIEQLERKRGSKVITLIHRKEPWTTKDAEPEIVLEDSETILDEIRKTPVDKPIDVILHTPGGVALAAEMIAMALKYHRGKVTVMIPFYAMSGGSLIALSADEIRMERYSILGPVDPQIEGMPAASLMSIVKRKRLDTISDRTLVLAQVAEMQTQNAKDFVKWLLREKLGDPNSEKVAEFLAGGYLAHETPITLDVARALGLNAVEGVPDLVYKLFKTCAFGEVTRPGELQTQSRGTSLE